MEIYDNNQFYDIWLKYVYNKISSEAEFRALGPRFKSLAELFAEEDEEEEDDDASLYIGGEIEIQIIVRLLDGMDGRFVDNRNLNDDN